MSFVSVSKTARQKMFRDGGFRERDIMKNSICITTALGRKDCVKFHCKDGKTATYRYGHGLIN